MYNGIGLKTPRGSGTNGYVVRNLSFVRPKPSLNGSNRNPKGLVPLKPQAQRPSEPVLLHRERRLIEIELLALREDLEQQQKGQEDIEDTIKSTRKQKWAELDSRLKTKSGLLKEAKEEELERVRHAFGIDLDNYEEGRAFNYPRKNDEPGSEVDSISNVNK